MVRATLGLQIDVLVWYPEGNERSLSRMFGYCTVEALRMRRFKRDWWKAGITIAGLLLLLVLMVGVPVSAAGAYEGASELATPVTITAQATPTEDATVTALNKEKLQHENDWWWSNGATILTGLLSTLVLVGGALIGFWQWRMNRNDIRAKESKDRQEAHDKDLKAQAEERFKTAIIALGDENEGTQVSGAILLRSFLNPDDKEIYGRYYTQIFDLAVAYLRLPSTSASSEDPNTPLPLTTLRQALITVFKEAFPLARDKLLKEQGTQFRPQSMDVSGIQLDNAYLWRADLEQVWMPLASLRGALLNEAVLNRARLYQVNLNGASLREAKLNEANFMGADLSDADLSDADLSDAVLSGGYRGNNTIRTNFNRADLSRANLSRAKIRWVDLSDADLRGADLRGADLRAGYRGNNIYRTNFNRANLHGANLEDALTLEETDLRGVKGLTKEQLEACKAKGAIIEEDTTANASESPVAPPAPSQSTNAQAPPTSSAQGSPSNADTSERSASVSQQSNDTQAPSAPSAQVNTPPVDADGSSITSSKPGSMS